MKNQLKGIFAGFGFRIRRIHPFENRAHEIYNKYKEFTMVSEKIFVENLKIIYDYKHIKGCIVECGVWRGGMIAGIAEMINNRVFYLFDSFEGLPEAKEIDGKKAIDWQMDKQNINYHDNCSAEIVYAQEAMEMSGSEYKIYKGWFKDTLKKTNFSDPIAVLRLDADWYDSTSDALEQLFPKVATGGIIILDDYYTWDGCSRAIHQYLNNSSSKSKIHKSPSGVPYIIKLD